MKFNWKIKKNDLLRLSIGKKVALAYLPLVLVIMVVAVYALLRLNHVHTLSKSIVEHDLVLIEASDQLLDQLLSQELYNKRYMILRSKDMLSQLRQYGNDFDSLVADIQYLKYHGYEQVKVLAPLHQRLTRLYLERIDSAAVLSDSLAEAYDTNIKLQSEKLTSHIQALSSMAVKARDGKIKETALIGRTAFRVMLILSFFGFLFGLGAAIIIARNILISIWQLRDATKGISEGHFNDFAIEEKDDEFGELVRAFRYMAEQLARLEEMHLDASPLTRLPGGVAIENILKNRLTTDTPVAFCLLDLDNFKAFNDRYGYAAGNDIIKTTAQIIAGAVKKKGNQDDFVGHIGGDDFAMVTTPDKQHEIADSIIKTFDKQVVQFYDSKDRKRGYIISKNRQGKVMHFPVMTVSIAGVISNLVKKLNHIEMGEIAAEMKEYAKSFKTSKFVVDRRGRSD